MHCHSFWFIYQQNQAFNEIYIESGTNGFTLRIFLNYYKHNGGARWTGKKMHVSPALYWIRWQNWVVELLEAFIDRRMHNIEQPANKEKQSSTITRKKLCGTFDFWFNNKLTSLFTPFSAIAVFSLSLKVEGKHLRKQKLSYGRFSKTEIRCLQCIAGRKRKPGSQSLLRVHPLARDKSRDVHSKAKKSNWQGLHDFYESFQF